MVQRKFNHHSNAQTIHAINWPELPESLAPKTQIDYESCKNNFCRRMGERGVPITFPVSPMYLAVFLFDRYRAGNSAGSLENHLKAIHKYHEAGGIPSPTDSAVVKDTMDTLKRRLKGREIRQAAPLLPWHIAAIEKTAKTPRPGETREKAERRGAEDIALVRFMFDAMLRSDEVPRALWKHISRGSDGKCGVLYVSSGKADQEGRGSARYLSPGTMQVLEAIRPKGAHSDRPLFGYKGRGSVRNRIKRIVVHAGLGDDFSGHSPRVGMAQTLAAGGFSAPLIAQAGGWANLDQVIRYSRKLTASRSAQARWYASRLYIRRGIFYPKRISNNPLDFTNGGMK